MLGAKKLESLSCCCLAPMFPLLAGVRLPTLCTDGLGRLRSGVPLKLELEGKLVRSVNTDPGAALDADEVDRIQPVGLIELVLVLEEDKDNGVVVVVAE